MTVESMITEGLYLMLVGMGFVVIFLTLLVQILNFTERYIDHEQTPEQHSADEGLNNNTLTAVISAAIHKHRQRHNK